MPSSQSSTTSAAASPTTTMTSTPSEPEDNNNNSNSLDDIFGSSPTDRHQRIPTEYEEDNRAHYDIQPSVATSATEPSDLPSLRRQHVTAGYRDGIAYSKAEHVQRGFDGGYPVGAQFGLRVGTILGILEGVVGGLESRAAGAGPVKKRTKRTTLQDSNKDVVRTEKGEEETQIQKQRIERIRQLYQNALKELDVEALFGGLKADDEEEEQKGKDFTEETKPENRLRQKADPVVARWEKVVDVTRWEESMEAVEGMEDHDEKELR